jgi:hypothetical protein
MIYGAVAVPYVLLHSLYATIVDLRPLLGFWRRRELTTHHVPRGNRGSIHRTSANSLALLEIHCAVPSRQRRSTTLVKAPTSLCVSSPRPCIFSPTLTRVMPLRFRSCVWMTSSISTGASFGRILSLEDAKESPYSRYYVAISTAHPWKHILTVLGGSLPRLGKLEDGTAECVPTSTNSPPCGCDKRCSFIYR